MLVLLFAAEVRFVNFNDAPQERRVVAASLAQPLKNEPCRLLSDPDFLRKLHGRDALARGH